MVVPDDELMKEASELSLPYFSIIEVPLKKYMVAKKLEKSNRMKDRTEVNTSNCLNQGSINMFWQMNYESFKHMKRKVQ